MFYTNQIRSSYQWYQSSDLRPWVMAPTREKTDAVISLEDVRSLQKLFREIASSLASVEKRLTSVDERLESVEKLTASMEVRIGEVKQNLGSKLSVIEDLLKLRKAEDQQSSEQKKPTKEEIQTSEIESVVGGSLKQIDQIHPPMAATEATKVEEEDMCVSVAKSLQEERMAELNRNTKKKKRKRWKERFQEIQKCLAENQIFGTVDTSLDCGNKWFGFGSTGVKVRHQLEREKLRRAKRDKCADQVLDKMLGKGKRVVRKNKNGSTQNGSCDSTGLEIPCTKPHVKKQFHRARFKLEKMCASGYVSSLLQIQRVLGDKGFYRVVEAQSTKNKPATKLSSSVQVRSVVNLGKNLQSQYSQMFYQIPCVFGHVKNVVTSVGSDEEKVCVAGRANQVWEPGGFVSIRSQLSWLERLGGIRIMKQDDAHIEAYVGVELLNVMQRRVMKPDWLLCGMLIGGLCGVEKIEADKLVMNKMQESGIKVQMLIYATVMDEYFKSGNSTKGLNLLEEKLKLDVEVRFFTFFPEESTSQLRSSSKDIGRGVVTDVTFIGEHSEDHLSSFFSYGRFGSPRPPERSFSHPIPFKTALLTFGFSFDESNIIRSIIHRVYKLGLRVDNEQVENRKVQRLPLARWVSKSDVFAFRAAIQLNMACTEINRDLGQRILHALLNDGYGNVPRTQNGIGELLYWEEMVIAGLLKLLPNPTEVEDNVLRGSTESWSSVEGYIAIMVSFFSMTLGTRSILMGPVLIRVECSRRRGKGIIVDSKD